MALPNYFQRTVTGTDPDTHIPLDVRLKPFTVSLQLIPSGGATAKVQYTLDDIWADGWTAGTANWVDHPYLTAITATSDSNLAFPVTAVRAVNTVAGSTKFTVIQAGLK
jgi:hypothetical protein